MPDIGRFESTLRKYDLGYQGTQDTHITRARDISFNVDGTNDSEY